MGFVDPWPGRYELSMKLASGWATIISIERFLAVVRQWKGQSYKLHYTPFP